MHLHKNRKCRDNTVCNIFFPNISTLSIYQREKHMTGNAKLIWENMKKTLESFIPAKESIILEKSDQ